MVTMGRYLTPPREWALFQRKGDDELDPWTEQRLTREEGVAGLVGARWVEATADGRAKSVSEQAHLGKSSKCTDHLNCLLKFYLIPMCFRILEFPEKDKNAL